MLAYEYVCFCCMIEDKCICVCLIPALISFDYVHGLFSRLCFDVRRVLFAGWRHGDMTEWYQSSGFQQWASMGHESAGTDAELLLAQQKTDWNFKKIAQVLEQSGHRRVW